MALETKRSVWKRSLLAARPLIITQGEVVHATNLLQDAFYRIFSVAISLERPQRWEASAVFHSHALAIWHVVQSDKQQREMAIAAISSIPTKINLRPALARLNWAKNKANKLTEYRNLVAHNPITFRAKAKGKGLEWTPNFGGQSLRPLHQRRLELIGGLKFWQTLRNDLIKLSEYVEAVSKEIQRIDLATRGIEYVGVPKSWPDRPRLPSYSRLLEIDRESKLEVPKSKRRNPPRPSRA